MTIFLETERLLLKPIEQADFDNLFALRSDPEVMKYTEQGAQTKEEVQSFIDITIPFQKKYGYDICSVFEKASGRFVGSAGLFRAENATQQPDIEIGYSFLKKYWGKGYATEVVKALIQWGFEDLPVTKLVAFTDHENIASHRVLQKCGMVKVEIEQEDLSKYEIYKNDSIELVPYNTEWQALAQLEIKQLRTQLPDNHIIDIQHVGSTAIPGIRAKPIIDLQIAVDSLAAIKQKAILNLKALGYKYWQDNPDLERMFFVKGMPPFGNKRTHHVHIVEPASRHWREKIQFRDYLLSHPEAAQEYEKLKMQLAKQHTHDREKYTDTKSHFVNSILQKANVSQNDQSPFIIFLTGASGAGKTTLINHFTNTISDKSKSIICLHFDSIGVPTLDEMIKEYGSTSEWQKAMTYHWVYKLINDYQNKKLVILEGQVNLDFIVSAFEGFNCNQYKIILAHCNNITRHKRLHHDRNQPELINENMDNWAEFLKQQAIAKNVAILDTTKLDADEMAGEFRKLAGIEMD